MSRSNYRITQPISLQSSRFQTIINSMNQRSLELMGSEVVIEREGLCDAENTICVAVGKNVKESKSVLLWASQHFAGCGRKLCLLHVHQPAQLLTLNSKTSWSTSTGVNHWTTGVLVRYFDYE